MVDNLKEAQLINEFFNMDDNCVKKNCNDDILSMIENMTNDEKENFFNDKIKKMEKFKDRWCGMYYHWFLLKNKNGNLYVVHEDSHEYSPHINTETFEFNQFIKDNLNYIKKNL